MEIWQAMNAPTSTPPTDVEARNAAEHASKAVDEVLRVFVGPRETVELLLVSLLSRGHVLLEGVPGVAKTTLAKTFAATISSEFRRIQFTPDLLPADITGTFILSPKEGVFQLHRGPVFANIVLGDEINRAPAKTQSALLEAMQEGQVTIEGNTQTLPSPFMVLATQNPVEQAGTYPLPEAQIDRFLLRLVIGYPEPHEERELLRRFLTPPEAPNTILDHSVIHAMQHLADRVHVADDVIDYVVRLVAFTRRQSTLFLGASPRGSLALLDACKAKALLDGRTFVLPDDVRRLAGPVLAHRLVLTPEAEMEGLRQDHFIEQAIRTVPLREANG